MTKSPTGIIPQVLDAPKYLPNVLEFLRSLRIDPQERKDLLFAWCRNVGCRARRADYESLED